MFQDSPKLLSGNGMRYISRYSIMYLLITISVFCGCISCYRKKSNAIEKIIFPRNVENDIAHEVIFFEKYVQYQSIVAILSLDLSRYEIIQLPDVVNQPEISQDTQVVVYVKRDIIGDIDPHSIWLYDIKMDEETRLAGWNEDILDIWISTPSFSYDGKSIIFTVTWFNSEKIGLAVVDIDGSNLRVLDTYSQICHGPEYSPNGERILICCPGIDILSGEPGFQICLLDQNGGYIKHLTNIGDSNNSYYFTPNGKYIVYSEVEFGGLFQIINKQLDRFIIMDTDGENKEVLLYWDVGILGFSDDSQQIIFEGRPTPKSPWGIYIINIDGTNLRHLTYFDEFLEEWYSDIEDY